MYVVAFTLCIALVNVGSVLVSNANANDMSVEYHACSVNGWNSWVGSGQECKVADGEAMTRFEMHMKTDSGDSADANIEYSVASEAGWSVMSNGGEMASAAGKPIKAININLTGDLANAYKVEYRACNSNGEWLAWGSNGTVVGNINGETYLTAIQIKVEQTMPINTVEQTGAEGQVPQTGMEGQTPQDQVQDATVDVTTNESDVQTTPVPEMSAAVQPVVYDENGVPMGTQAPGQTPEPEMIEYEPTIAPEYSDDDMIPVQNGDTNTDSTETEDTGSADDTTNETVVTDNPIVGSQPDQGTGEDTSAPDSEETIAPDIQPSVSSAAEALIAKAESQLGKGRESDNSTIYGAWWANRVNDTVFRDAKWCAMFLSWCANEAGVSEKTIGYFAACSYWQKWFTDNGRWQSKDGYTPVRGDILFLDYDANGEANHNGIVKSVSGNTVTVIEGNVNDKVDNVTYDLSNEQIIGYGKPDYDNNEANVQKDAEEKKQQEETGAASGLAQKILEKAFSQRGTREGKNGWTKYGQWYNDNIDRGGFANAHWCAMFVSWCADQVGVPRDVIKPYASCWYGLQDLKTMATYHEASSGYVPQPGDIFFYHFSKSGAGHTGLVEKVQDRQIFTIEGNTADSVDARTYPLSNNKIKGYITPRY